MVSKINLSKPNLNKYHHWLNKKYDNSTTTNQCYNIPNDFFKQYNSADICKNIFLIDYLFYNLYKNQPVTKNMIRYDMLESFYEFVYVNSINSNYSYYSVLTPTNKNRLSIDSYDMYCSVVDNINSKQLSMLDVINSLYCNVIEKFKSGNMDIYDDVIISKVTLLKFTQWIFSNNKRIYDEYVDHTV